LIAQARSPAAGALLIERAGPHVTLVTLAAVAAINVALIAALWRLCRPAASVV
jgi:hypothetical protein